MPIRVSEVDVRRAVEESRSWSETLRRLGYCTTGNNRVTIKKYVAIWNISTEHFDPHAVRRDTLRRANQPIPLDQILVQGSSFSRGHLKKRLYREGLKEPRCELCDQGEIWRGRKMSLILDHINGVRNDHRLENLRIICPNCAATLDTHCGRNVPRERSCLACGKQFIPQVARHRYCSLRCVGQARKGSNGGGSTFGIPKPNRRQVKRPSYPELILDTAELGFCAVGRKHGVSDNAIRKWIRFYENEMMRVRLDRVAGTAPAISGNPEAGSQAGRRN